MSLVFRFLNFLNTFLSFALLSFCGTRENLFQSLYELSVGILGYKNLKKRRVFLETIRESKKLVWFWLQLFIYSRLVYILYIRILLQWAIKLRRNETMCRSLDKIVEEGGADRPCFYFEDEIWTYKQVWFGIYSISVYFASLEILMQIWHYLKVQDMSFRVANYFQQKGIKKGDAVGLAMTNRPEVVAIWLGLY